MQVVSQTKPCGEYTPDVGERSRVLPTIAIRSYALVAIITLGAVLRVYGLAAYSLAGDEYNSLTEAQNLGLNWNSIIYSTLMHFWVTVSSTEIWLRLPAAFFGVATIPLISHAGAKLDGWRTGAIAGLLAATSPFNIYHSQEVRFYSLFMFAAAAFLLATVHYVQSKKKTIKSQLSIVATGLLLLVSHFMGVVALCAQGAATFLAVKRRKLSTALALTIGVPLLLFGLPLLPPVRKFLLGLYETYGNALGSDTTITSFSVVSLAKIGFAGFTFVFGYHVYPLRLLLVIPGLMLSAFLVTCGLVRLVQQQKWALLGVTYGIVLIGVYLVLDSVGGRVASGVSPRHVVFIWPIFIVLLALGLSTFHRTAFRLLLFAVLIVNAISLLYGWRKDWSYGPATDYRAAAEYVSHHATADAAIIFAGRAAGPADYYFPKTLRRLDWSSSLTSGDAAPLIRTERVIFVSDDWHQSQRGRFNWLLQRLTEHYNRVEGRVDYPMFEYVFDRSSPNSESVAPTGAARQLKQPLSIYGLEFQDLKLPVSISFKGSTLQVIGATELPNADGERMTTLSLGGEPAERLLLLTNATFSHVPAPETTIAEILVEDATGVVKRFALRLGIETASWDQTCRPGANCETVFHWHKRMAMTGQNSYPGAWRDFEAGIHATTLDLQRAVGVKRVSIRYLANEGNIYVWGVALHAGKL
jgi:hypothetical protein